MSSAALSHRVPQEIWGKQVADENDQAADWIWPGLLARGNTTLLTSMWKAGKTTLLTHLLHRRGAGGPLLGLPLAPGKSIVISEEPRSLWAERCRRFDLAEHLCLFPQPFHHVPSQADWIALLERVGQLHDEHGIDLVVVDSLTHFLSSESAARMLGLLMPVRQLTARGLAALLLHHPSKRGAALGAAARGHGALHAEVDISIEMRHPGGNLDSRARRFFCLSRHSATPRHFLFELAADAADYTVLPTPDDDGFDENWQVLHMVLLDAPQKLTRLDILDEWPEDFAAPHPRTLHKWLNRAVAANLVLVEGSGRKADPFRYWLPAAETRWRQDELYDILEQQRIQLKQPFMSLRELKRQRSACSGQLSAVTGQWSVVRSP